MTDSLNEPPRWTRRMLRRILGMGKGADALEDVDSEYRIVRGRRGSAIAGIWYFTQLLRPDTWQLARVIRRAEDGRLTPRRYPLRISWLDLRLGVRMLVKHPGLTIVATLALGVGIPAGLAPGHVARVEQTALPVREADRIKVLRYLDTTSGRLHTPFIDEFRDWRDNLSSWRSVAFTSLQRRYNVVTRDGRSEPVQGAAVTPSFFEILEVPPLLGRPLVASDDVPDAPHVVVIGHALWRSRFGADPDVVGRQVRVGGVQRTVVGVMPEDFRFPYRDELWLPLQSNDVSVSAGEPVPFRRASSLVFGRLRDGVSTEQAEDELAAVRNHWVAQRTEPIRAAPGVDYASLKPQVVGFLTGLFAKPAGAPSGPAVLAQLLGLLVLVVACANVGMLIFARTAARTSELAVRTALGASRRRIVFQLFVEALVIALIATGVGLLVAQGAVSQLLEAYQEAQPYWLDYGISLETMLWALALATGSAVIAGTIPALRVTGAGLRIRLGRATTGAPLRFGGLYGVLTVTNVALAVATVGAGAFLWLARPELATSAELSPRLVVAEVAIPNRSVRQGPITDDISVEDWVRAYTDKVLALRVELVRRLKTQAEIVDVSIADVLPGSPPNTRYVEIEAVASAGALGSRRARVTHVHPGFFEAIGRPFLTGSEFGAVNLEATATSVIAGSTFARRVLGERNPLGRRLRYTDGRGEPAGPWYEIVGVVDDTGLEGGQGIGGIGEDRAEGGLYFPLADETRSFDLIVRLEANPGSFAPRLRRLIAEIDPTYIVSEPQPLRTVVASSEFRATAPIKAAILLTGFLVVLAAAGTHALMSLTVSQRRREIGIRTALGAQANDITGLVARRAIGQLGVGSVLGAPLAWWILRGAEVPGLGGSRLVVAVVLACGVALVVAALACTGPIVRALRVMPSETLQSEA